MTDQERERRVFDIFAQTCGLATSPERAAALESACAGDAELRRRVEAMLDADAKANNHEGHEGGFIGNDAAIDAFVERQIRQILPGAEPTLRAESPAIDGEYTLLRLIGEGGMGAVYEAEQHEPRRRVAIKAIRPGRITPQMRKRFEYEAQVLARLEHPGIARLYESNTQSEGGAVRAFLAMELVRGEPIDAYASNRQLDLAARLRLYMRVCEAVAYAHRMGVIHRDLKPANILVNDDAQPKVLDFGVARTIEDDKLAATHLTQHGQIVGTLAFMSPEQVEGRAEIDTRTDVYALGVILYKLLTGVLPIAVNDVNLVVATGRVLEEVPRRVGHFNRQLKGDLELIVARTLEKEPSRRYGSVDQLRDEIERYLSGRPIQARGDSTLYWLRKALWRHRALVGACVLLIGLLTLFGIHSAIQAQQNRRLALAASKARDEAVRSEARATERAADLRRLLYVNNISFAQSAMENNDVDRARLLLDGCDPALRDWEWGYLQRLCDLSSQTTDLQLQRPRYASFSSDRSRVALATLDREVALRDNTTGRTLMRERLPDGTARAAISGDGRWLAYGGVLESVTLVDLTSGAKRELKVTLPAALEPTYHFLRLVCFSPDSGSVVVAGLDGLVRVWDVSSATVRTKIELGKPLPICMLLLPNGDCAAIGDSTGRLRLFDLRSGTLLRELKGHDAAIWSLAVSRDGQRLASGDNDARVIVWNLADGHVIAEQDTNDGWITALCFSPDAATLAMGRADSTIRLLHVADAAPAGVLRGHRHGVISIDWRDDDTLHTVSLDGTAKTWNAHAALQVPTIVTRLPQTGGLAFDPTGRSLFAGGLEGTVRGWAINPDSNDPPPQAKRVSAHADPVMEITTDRTRGSVCTSGRDGVLCISSLNDDGAASTHITTQHNGGISAIDFSRDGTRLVVSGGGAISMWDPDSRAKLGDYASSNVVANDLSFAVDGQSFYAACGDGHVRRWRIGSPTPVADVKLDLGTGVYDVDVSPDGKTVAAGGDTQTLVLLDAQTLQVIRRFVGHQGAVFGVAFHPQGKRLASCGSDRIIRIWDLETGTELIALRGHRRTVYHVQFSPDGQTLASSSDDGTIKLWRTPAR